MPGSIHTSREKIFKKSLVVIAKAARNGVAVHAGHEARRLLKEHPDCGMTERDIIEHLVGLAVEGGLSVDTM